MKEQEADMGNHEMSGKKKNVLSTLYISISEK